MYNRFWGRDRRRFQRLKVNLDVSYRVESPLTLRNAFGDREVNATVMDISERGMAILSQHCIPQWSVLLLNFMLFKTDRLGTVSFSDPVEILGEVRSSYMTETGQYRLGVCFKLVRSGNPEAISDFASESLRQ